MGARGAFRQECNRARFKQRVSQGVGGADVRLRRALPDDDAVADTGDVLGRAWDKAGPCGAIVEKVDRHHCGVERLARYNSLDRVGSGIEMKEKLMAGGLLEARGQFI